MAHRKSTRNSNVQRGNTFRRHLWHGPVGPLLLVLGALLVYQVATSIQLARGQQTSAAPVAADKSLARGESDNVIAIDADRPTKSSKRLNKQNKLQAGNFSSDSRSPTHKQLACDYDKGQWNDCQPDGSQTKVMRLKWGDRECKANKTIRRDCEAVGCKYARGQWSSVCVDGQRFRLDTLVERLEPKRPNHQETPPNSACKPSRRVTKDCQRTCHYLKSAWSECLNGFRTRTLTLAEPTDAEGGPSRAGRASPLIGNNKLAVGASQPAATVAPAAASANQQCAPRKLIRRACRAKPTASETATAANNNNMTPAQRRRLKQQQQQQLKQPLHQTRVATTKPSGQNTTSTTTTTTSSSTTSPRSSAAGGNKPATTTATAAAAASGNKRR